MKIGKKKRGGKETVPKCSRNLNSAHESWSNSVSFIRQLFQQISRLLCIYTFRSKGDWIYDDLKASTILSLTFKLLLCTSFVSKKSYLRPFHFLSYQNREYHTIERIVDVCTCEFILNSYKLVYQPCTSRNKFQV